MKLKTYINGRDKKILRKLLQKELKNLRLLVDIDTELYGFYWTNQRRGLVKRGIILNELLDKLQ